MFSPRSAAILSRGMILRESTTLSPGVYVLPDGITIAADGVHLNGGGAVLVGGRHGRGIQIEGRRGVRISNCCLRDYEHGIHASQCRDLTIVGNEIRATGET